MKPASTMSAVSIRVRVAILGGVCLLAAGCSTADDNAPPASETASSGWQGASLKPDKEMIAAGRLVAQSECASCHAIDEVSASPNPSAPPLRDAIATYDPDFLAYRLIEAMRIGHDEMPLFDFDIRSADALIAYMKSLGGK